MFSKRTATWTETSEGFFEKFLQDCNFAYKVDSYQRCHMNCLKGCTGSQWYNVIMKTVSHSCPRNMVAT